MTVEEICTEIVCLVNSEDHERNGACMADYSTQFDICCQKCRELSYLTGIKPVFDNLYQNEIEYVLRGNKMGMAPDLDEMIDWFNEFEAKHLKP